jgi:putative DNA primase/helicase
MNPTTQCTLSEAHLRLLTDSAITPGVIATSGIAEYTSRGKTGLLFPWDDGREQPVMQLRPDNPSKDDDGRLIKYLFPKGSKVGFNRVRDNENCTKVIIVEGTKQQYAAASHAPAEYAVYGMSGCRGYVHADLSVVDGRDAFLLLDADVSTNRDVWEAADELRERLHLSNANEVSIVKTIGQGKQGLDDALAMFDNDEARGNALRTWLAKAGPKLPRRPARKRASVGDADRFFKAAGAPVEFSAQDAAIAMIEANPCAIAQNHDILFYERGAFRVNPMAFQYACTRMLGNGYTHSRMEQMEAHARQQLSDDGMEMVDRQGVALFNCANGMVDLRTGRMLPHDQKYLSTAQSPIPYDPDVATPLYLEWLHKSLRRPGMDDAALDDMIDDLEETVGTMLDPSRTASKALFVFGPSRSGKSTMLRILAKIAGHENHSAMSLHQLSENRFMSANLYGKMLNVSADLSSRHVKDLSAWKMITGDDPIEAERKGKQPFSFTNQAMMAFSANEVPTVNEESAAYVERIKPFEFPNSFAGHEDKTLEVRMDAELPGILTRWVRAYQRFLARGGYRPSDAETMQKFARKSDLVAQFAGEMLRFTDAEADRVGPADKVTNRKAVYDAFNQWSKDQNIRIGRNNFYARLHNAGNLVLCKTKDKALAFNVVITTGDEHQEDIEPDPIEESGVLDMDDAWGVPKLPAVPEPQMPAETAQAASVAPLSVEPVPVATEPVIERLTPVQGLTYMDALKDGFDAPDPFADSDPFA